MLPFSRSRRNSRPKTCICKCRSHCTVYDPTTGLYIGDGNEVSRGDRDNHARDDKRLTAHARPINPCSRVHLPSNGRAGVRSLTTVHEASTRPYWLTFIENEVRLLKELPITSPTSPLVFINSPATHGEYNFPPEAEYPQPNAGLHALRFGPRANAAFLAAENRICELIAHVRTTQQSDDMAALLAELGDQRNRLNFEKEFQWAQQRGGLVNDKVMVNTGGLSMPPLVFLSYDSPRDTLLPAWSPKCNGKSSIAYVSCIGKHLLYAT